MTEPRYLALDGPPHLNGMYLTLAEGLEAGYELAVWPGTDEDVLVEAGMTFDDEPEFDG